MNIRAVYAAVFVVFVAACNQTPMGRTHSAEELTHAEALASAAADQLSEQLRNELVSAMQNGGPVAAVSVCRDRAPIIAAEIEAQTGVDIERTALRVRNPDNAPTAWETDTLEGFVSRRLEGTAWADMTARRVDGANLLWMRPIPMGAMCSSCHGSTEIAPDTQAAIASEYPTDAATGFAEGELRGAFTALVPLP
jgi:hypothetical protein